MIALAVLHSWVILCRLELDRSRGLAIETGVERTEMTPLRSQKWLPQRRTRSKTKTTVTSSATNVMA